MLRLIGSVTILSLLLVACGGESSSGSPAIVGDSGGSGSAGSGTLAITSKSPPGGMVGVEYKTQVGCHGGYYCPPRIGFTLSASGGNGNYSWTWAAANGSSLPSGLSFTDGKITGTPAVGSAGDHVVVVSVADSGTPSMTATQQYTITIVNPPLPVIAASPGPYGATLNQPYNYQFLASGLGPLSFTESGALPPGLLPMTTTGLLAGTPTSLNAYPITVYATDIAGQRSATQTFTISAYTHGFSPAGTMQVARTGHTATLLASGRVLVVGGQSPAGIEATAELFDPASAHSAAAGMPRVARLGHAATLLCNLAAPPCTDPRVLIVGGLNVTSEIGTAELYDPVAGTFTLTTGNLITPRQYATTTLLPSGKVLIVGGMEAQSATSLASAELFDPATGTFSATAGPMAHGRVGHTATLLPDGRVLIAGGADTSYEYLDSAELYDPASNTFSAVPNPMIAKREGHTATLLPSGKVLIVGGWGDSTSSYDIAEIYDPAAVAPAASFTATGPVVTLRYYHSAVLLPSGKVLIAGGNPAEGCCMPGMSLHHAELYDPATGLFTATGGMYTGRENPTAILLNDSGQVLVMGGDDGNQGPSEVSFSTAETYQ